MIFIEKKHTCTTRICLKIRLVNTLNFLIIKVSQPQLFGKFTYGKIVVIIILIVRNYDLIAGVKI